MSSLDCCHIAVVLAVISGVETALFLGYSVKIGTKQIELEKYDKTNHLRIKELEKKNGHELHKIEELQQQINRLKEQAKTATNKRENY